MLSHLHLSTCSLMYPLTCSFTYSSIHLSTCSVIYSLLGSVAYLTTHSHSHSIGVRLECGVLTKWSGNCPCFNKLQNTELWQTSSVPRGILPPCSFQVPAGIGGFVSGLYSISYWPVASLHVLLATWTLGQDQQLSSIPTASLVKPHEPPPIFSSPMEWEF